jgi:hypothetical protein
MRSFLYISGLILIILGIFGIFNAIGTLFLRIFVIVLGAGLLTIFFIKQKRK